MNILKLSFIILSLGGLSAQASHLNTAKMPLTRDATSSIDPIAGWQGFQLNFENRPLLVSTNMQLLLGFPAIGHYGADYNWKKRLALITLNRAMAKNLVPQDLQQALVVQGVNLDTVANLTTSFMVLGNVIDQAHDSPDRAYNVVYHPWIGMRHAQGQTVPYFHEVVAMGVFQGQGVSPLGDVASPDGNLPFNQILPKNVIWHDPFAISPNNARITMEGVFGAFWVVAVSADKNAVSLTYLLTANNPEAEEYLVYLLRDAQNIAEIRQFHEERIDTTAFTGANKAILAQWINALSNLNTPQNLPQGAGPRPQPGPMPVVGQPLPVPVMPVQPMVIPGAQPIPVPSVARPTPARLSVRPIVTPAPQTTLRPVAGQPAGIRPRQPSAPSSQVLKPRTGTAVKPAAKRVVKKQISAKRAASVKKTQRPGARVSRRLVKRTTVSKTSAKTVRKKSSLAPKQKTTQTKRGSQARKK